MYCLTSLSNLVVSGKPAGVDGNSGSANYAAAKSVSQLTSQFNTLLDIFTDTTTYRYDNICTDQVYDLLSFFYNVQYLSLDVILSQSYSCLLYTSRCV